MASKPTIQEIFNALIEYRTQGGSLPTVRELSDASLSVTTFIAAYTQVREIATQVGMSQSLARAIEAADGAVAALQGRSDNDATTVAVPQ